MTILEVKSAQERVGNPKIIFEKVKHMSVLGKNKKSPPPKRGERPSQKPILKHSYIGGEADFFFLLKSW
ncbi:MAG: hypothetical protein AAF573_14755 [Bacteroidota bacterium]